MLVLKWNGSFGLVEEFRKLIEEGGIDLKADENSKKEMSFNGRAFRVHQESFRTYWVRQAAKVLSLC